MAGASESSIFKFLLGNSDANTCENGLRLVIDETKKTMKIGREVPLDEIADLSLFREAQKQTVFR